MERIDTGYHDDKDNLSNPWYNGPGWYFYDETEQMNGPFDTDEKAKAALKHYVKHEL